MSKFQKALSWVVKLGGVVITIPVTWLVAGDLFHDVSPFIRVIMQIAGVSLVEGVFLGSWLLLEYDIRAPAEIKTRYALTALGMYAGLWLLAIQHGEGVAGLVFRAALGAALIGAGWDTYVKTFSTIANRADRDAANTRKVKRLNRRLSIREKQIARQAWHRVMLARIEKETEANLLEVEMFGARRIKEVKIEDAEERKQLDKKQAILMPARTRKRGKKATDEELKAEILKEYAQNPKRNRQRFAKELKIGETKIYDLLRELESEGAIIRDGHSVLVQLDGVDAEQSGPVEGKRFL